MTRSSARPLETTCARCGHLHRGATVGHGVVTYDFGPTLRCITEACPCPGYRTQEQQEALVALSSVCATLRTGVMLKVPDLDVGKVAWALLEAAEKMREVFP